ncbi:MAG: permease [Campylobacteraceae bacterium]|nr:permease [Campylobacteraceae bacterium]
MWKEAVDYLTVDILGLSGKLNDTLNFFIYDTFKIWFLLIAIIFVVSYLRTHFNTEYVRAHLQGKSQFYGNLLASLFGIITPFCSCSAIPLFLGFIQARIPLGVTFSFLISSPMNNEIAIALLFGLFGWKITAIYIGLGLLVAVLGGFVIGKMNMERYILLDVKPMEAELEEVKIKLTFKQRAGEAWEYTADIFKKIWFYVLIGVGVGALIHGYVPADLIVKYAGPNNPFAPFIAVLAGIPMYSNAAGVMPLVEVLTAKGMALGTALSFMMAITALSLPEAMILKRILHVRLIAMFFGIVGLGIIGIGYLFNFIL